MDEGILSANERVVDVFKNATNKGDIQEIEDEYVDDDDIDNDYIN